MVKKVLFFTCTLIFCLGFVGPLTGQDAAERGKAESDPVAISVIELAEKKLYSPINYGLTDLQVIQQLGFKKRLRTLWFKKPHMGIGILGRPEEENKDAANSLMELTEPVYVKMYVHEMGVMRAVGKLLGKPLSCLYPFGTFSIINKDEEGSQLRFTVNPKLVGAPWSYIDFFLDPDFILTKVMDRSQGAGSGQIDETKIYFKPYMENSELLIIDYETVLGTSSTWSTGMKNTYQYVPVGDFLLPDTVEMEMIGKDMTLTEKYLEYTINQGLTDDFFMKAKEK